MKIIPHLSRFGRHVLLGCLVATALALSIIRFWLLPRAADWREALQENIGGMINETVRIKSLSAGMRGFEPELMMRGFRIESAVPDGKALEFDRLGVGLDVPRSLLSGQPVVDRIDLQGGRLRLSRNPDGTIAVAGLQSGGPPIWLFAEGEVRFSDIDLEWIDDKEGQVTGLGRAQARLRNRGNRHILDARMDLPGKLGKSLRLSADIEGNPLGVQSWNARTYLEVRRLREGAFGESLPVRLRSGEVSFQAWGEWRDGVVSQVVGRVDLDRPVFIWRSETGSEGMLSLHKLGGWLRWDRKGSGWSLEVKDLTFDHNGRSWPESDYALDVDQAPDGGLHSLRASFGYLQLNELLSILGSFPLLDEKTRETLTIYSPRGEVRDGRLVYQADGHFGFCGDLAGFGFNQNQGLPALNRFTGRVCGNDREGRIDLKTTKTELDLPGLYQQSLAIDTLNGSLEWRRFRQNAPASANTAAGLLSGLLEGSAWRIVGNHIQLAAPGLHADADFALDLPAGEGKSPVIDLKAQFFDTDAARLRDYLPLALMSTGPATWLREAFDAGKVRKAELLLRGNLADFPFPYGEGLFETRVEAEDMELDFNPEWPHLYGVTAKVLFFGSRMFIDSEGGRIGDVPLGTVHAETVDFIGDGWLGVSGEVDTDLASAMKFLQKTPIRRIPERLSRVADPSGETHLDLKLSIPMTFGMGDVGVQGLLQLKNDKLALKGVNLEVQDLSGELSFTENGMEGKQIAGKSMNEPILIDVGQQNGEIRFDITGKTSMGALRKVFPGELMKYADGGFGYRLALQIPESLDPASAPVRIGLRSDLTGLELKLPSPLSKPAAVGKEFSAELTLRRGDNFSLNLGYGNEGRARLLFSGANAFRLKAGDLIWRQAQHPSPDQAGLGIFVKLDELDVGSWRKILMECGDGVFAAPPRALDVQIEKLLWNGEDLGSLMLTGKGEAGEIMGEVDGRYARGSYSASIPEFGYAALRLDLDALNVPKFPEEREGQNSMSPANPARWPALQVSARHLLWQGVDLGALELETERWTSGLNIKSLTLGAKSHDLSLKGSWMRQEDRDETRLEGKLKVRDLGNFLASLGYGREILFTPTDAVFSLSWPGAPQQFSSASVAGEVSLKLGRGRVLQMDPGLGRALGVLNLYTLRRLLLLDFSDLFGEGLAYDSMEGVFQLGEGQAITKRLVIDAVAADILIMGRVGLVNRDLDETISVVPHTMASIPLAGAIIGREAVGAVIDMAHRLVGAEDDNVASTNYSVTGAWDNPKIKRLEGSMSLDVIDRAWSDFKDISGIRNKGNKRQE